MRSNLVLVTAVAQEALTLAEVKLHLRVDDTADDALITSLIETARLSLEGADGWLGRALMPQTWDLFLDRFPRTWLGDYPTYDGYYPEFPLPLSLTYFEVPLPPLTAITFVKYVDPAGALQTWNSSNYVVDASAEPGRVYLAPGISWPDTKNIPNAVQVRFVAGYPIVSTLPTTPRPIRTAMLGLIADMYENRAQSAEVSPAWVRALLAPYRVYLSRCSR